MRSRQVSETMVWWLQPVHTQRVQAAIPSEYLLRKAILASSTPSAVPYYLSAPTQASASPAALSPESFTSLHHTTQASPPAPVTFKIKYLVSRAGWISTAVCESISRDSSIEPTLSYNAAKLLDSKPHQVVSDCWPLAMSNYTDLVCCETLRCFASRMLHIAVVEQLCCVKSRIAYILSKTIPQRCMTRKFNPVCADIFSTNPSMEMKVKQIFLCSLIGNYPFCDAASRPCTELRWILRVVLHRSKHKGTFEYKWFQTVFRHSGHLVEFVLREYLVYMVEDNPSLLSQMSHVFDWPAFRSITIEAMNQVRGYLGLSWALPESAFRKSLSRPTASLSNDPSASLTPSAASGLYTADASGASDLHSDIKSIVDVFHERLLAICYKRKNVSIVAALTTLRRYVPLTSQIHSVFENSHPRAPPTPDTLLVHKGVDDRDDQEAPIPHDLSEFVSPHQYHAMKRILLSLLACGNTHNVLLQAVAFFPFFGVGEAALQKIRIGVHALYTDQLSNPQQHELMRDIKAADAFAYNLLQVTADIIKEVTSFSYIRVLPQHIWKYQIQAVQERFGLVPKAGSPPVMPSSQLYLRFCQVCDKIYTLYRRFGSAYKNEYTFGFRDAVVDFATLELYCIRNKSNHRGRCGAEPLAKIPLTGHLLNFNGRCFMQCPQRSCGVAMVLDTKRCEYTERGPACCDCTALIMRDRVTTTAMASIVDRSPMCLMCVKPTKRSDHIFLYPHGVILCKKHNAFGTPTVIRRKKPQNKKETQDVIVAYLHELRERRRKARLPSLKRDLARRKQASRSNIRR